MYNNVFSFMCIGFMTTYAKFSLFELILIVLVITKSLSRHH